MSTRSASSAAHASATASAPQVRVQVLTEIVRAPAGMTCDEVETVLALKHQTASARIRELAVDNEITDSGQYRLTRSGHKAVVWIAATNEPGIDPPLKWLGGKRFLVPKLRALYEPHRHRTLVEPFVGGMAVALGLRPERALLADSNAHLINFYEWLQKGLKITLSMESTQECYTSHRETFNGLIEAGCLYEQEMAELFYYLNRTGFNGVCRFNKAGFFNVPFGKAGRRNKVEYRNDFFEYIDVLKNWRIERWDFKTLPIESGAFVYADPPYDDGFTQYTDGAGFTWDDQVKLADKLAAHDGPVVASNKATDRIVALYRERGFDIELIEAPRRVSSNGDRKPVVEVLATKGLTGGKDKASIASSSNTLTLTFDQMLKEIYMSQDISSELGSLIAKSKSFDNSDNIRVGKYRFEIKKVFAEKVDSGRFAFAELRVVKSEPNPQVMPQGVTAAQFDDGTRPNLINSACAMKVNFDGPGAKSAPGNVKGFVLGLFGFNQNETSEDLINATWIDLTRQKDQNIGDAIGLNGNEVIKADKFKPANPGCGMYIDCIASMKEKKKTREVKDLDPSKREYITQLKWECASKPGTGENASALVATRRALILSNTATDLDDDEDDTALPATPPQLPAAAASSAPTAPAAAPAAPQPPAPAAPQAPPVEFTPQAPWVPHTTVPVDANGIRWFWSNPANGGTNAVMSEAQLRSGT